MATSPQGKKPAPRKTPPKPAASPVARKKAAGKAAPAPKAPPAPAKKAPAKKAPAPRVKAAAPVKRVKGAERKKAPARPAPAPAEPSKVDARESALTEKQQRFVEEYMVDLNATQAAIRAGYSANTAAEQGYDHLRKPQIQLAIAQARREQQARTAITADLVLMRIADIALADPRELVEVKTGCCRCCYGEGHKFQRTVGEMNRDRELWIDKGKNPAEFDHAGGIGFNPLLLPVHDCPECGGDGQARTVLKDTRNLSARAAALYAGAKQTKYGIEVLTLSQMDALEKLAKYVGLYEKDNQQKTDPLASLLHRIAAGNGNGFKPVADDPEAPPASGTNSILPRSDVDGGA